jgi:radical SAM superfamily enzyme YgiQ (UPF0313 family)
LVRCIKQRLPNTIVVVGGIHATAKPEWHFEEAAPDFVVLGEGEETIVDLLGELCSDAGDPARVPGIVFRDCGGGLHRTQPRMPAESLRTGWCYNTVLRMPDGQPRYSDRLARKSPIYSSEVAGEEAGVFSLYGTRGCAGSCNYCTATRRDGKLIRHLGDDALFRQFRLVRRQFHVAVFCNQADAFGVHPADSSFLKMVADYRRVTGDVGFVLNNPNAFRLQRLFSQNARPEVDDSFLDLLQDSGFNVITLAIETVNQRFNSKIDWAKIRYEQVTELCQAIRAKGMKSDVYMMYGFPDETAEEFNADLAFAEGLRRWVDQVTWHSLSLLPGTAYYDEYVVRTGREDAYRRIIRDGYGCHMPRREFNVSRVPTERFEAALASFGKGWS